MEPAAPYAEPTAARPTYSPMAHAPSWKSAAVSSAPVHASRHETRVSGSTLKISAKTPDVIASVTTMWIGTASAARVPSSVPSWSPSAVSSALASMDTSSRKPRQNTMAIEMRRVRRNSSRPRRREDTPQTALSPSCSCANTAEAPSASMTTPRPAAMPPEPVRCSSRPSVRMSSSPCAPSRSPTAAATRLCTSSRSTMRPVTPSVMTTSGASESAE